MIQRIEMEICGDNTKSFGFNLGSVMQGVIMQTIDSEYAEQLHMSALHPYSQFVSRWDNGFVWTVCALDSKACEKIISPLAADGFSEIFLRDHDSSFKVKSKSVSTTSCEELFKDNFFHSDGQRYVTVEFMTPTSFKVNGKYTIFPDAYHIIQSLIKRFDSVSEMLYANDETLMNAIFTDCEICDYKLRSTRFFVEKTKIPAFIGRVTIKIRGTQDFTRLVNMLLRFGEFSGTGIKTSMGMGAYKIITGGVTDG